MTYKLLGNTGVKVSSLCMGTMTFGKEADEAESRALFNRCREAGINFFDCANVYAQGRAEEILGNLIRDCRDELVITTKAFGRTAEDINAAGTSRRHIMASVEQSLRRLKTDRIDLYFLHHFDPEAELEDSLRALDDLVRQGKILYPAASNFAAWQTEKALAISRREGWSPLRCIEPMYNLVKRQAEVEILPMAAEEKLAVIPYNPLAGGVLTGKYLPEEQPPAAGRLLVDQQYRQRYADPRIAEAVGKFVRFARERGYHPASLAVAWVAHHPAVTAPILGARSTAQLEDSLGSLEIDMTPELYREVSSLSIAPPHATDR
jgi:aryl-alcohol dehydrogenase-like predicted oxidoreductase